MRSGRPPEAERKHIFENGSLSVVKVAIDRCGICQASRSASAPPRPTCAARCSSRPPACSGARDPPDMHVFLRRSAAPHVPVRRCREACQSAHQDHLPGARRVQRLRRVRSDICTCRPYLLHGIEECARSAQAGASASSSTIARKDARSASHQVPGLQCRKRRKAATRPRPISSARVRRGSAGRPLPAMMPDRSTGSACGARSLRLHEHMSTMRWSRRHRDRRAGSDPDDLVPPDAHVEINAKRAAGYYSLEPPRPEI